MGHSDTDKPPGRGAENRATVRVIYETLLLVAEYDGDDFPPFSAFWEVKTKDLSPTGVGFVSPRRPKTTHLLLLFGNPQANPICIKARIAHCVEKNNEEGIYYQLGCELLQRVRG